MEIELRKQQKIAAKQSEIIMLTAPYKENSLFLTKKNPERLLPGRSITLKS
jgi:hypothetical protein